MKQNGLKIKHRCGKGNDANDALANLANHAIPHVSKHLDARLNYVFDGDEIGVYETVVLQGAQKN